MNPSSVGYRYLIDAISIVIEKPVHNISEIVAKKYNQKGSSVERAMQNAIKVTWNRADIDALLENYTGRITSDKGYPTLTEFIYYYANKINICIYEVC